MYEHTNTTNTTAHLGSCITIPCVSLHTVTPATIIAISSLYCQCKMQLMLFLLLVSLLNLPDNTVTHTRMLLLVFQS